MHMAAVQRAIGGATIILRQMTQWTQNTLSRNVGVSAGAAHSFQQALNLNPGDRVLRQVQHCSICSSTRHKAAHVTFEACTSGQRARMQLT